LSLCDRCLAERVITARCVSFVRLSLRASAPSRPDNSLASEHRIVYRFLRNAEAMTRARVLCGSYAGDEELEATATKINDPIADPRSILFEHSAFERWNFSYFNTRAALFCQRYRFPSLAPRARG